MRIAVFWAGRAKRSFSVFWKGFFSAVLWLFITHYWPES